MGVNGLVAPPADVGMVLGASGVRIDTTVVIYGDDNGLTAARLLWTMEYYDHPDVHLLDGGWMQWQAEGRPTSMLDPSPPPCRTTSLSPTTSFTWTETGSSPTWAIRPSPWWTCDPTPSTPPATSPAPSTTSGATP